MSYPFDQLLSSPSDLDTWRRGDHDCSSPQLLSLSHSLSHLYIWGPWASLHDFHDHVDFTFLFHLSLSPRKSSLLSLSFSLHSIFSSCLERGKHLLPIPLLPHELIWDLGLNKPNLELNLSYFYIKRLSHPLDHRVLSPTITEGCHLPLAWSLAFFLGQFEGGLHIPLHPFFWEIAIYFSLPLN